MTTVSLKLSRLFTNLTRYFYLNLLKYLRRFRQYPFGFCRRKKSILVTTKTTKTTPSSSSSWWLSTWIAIVVLVAGGILFLAMWFGWIGWFIGTFARKIAYASHDDMRDMSEIHEEIGVGMEKGVGMSIGGTGDWIVGRGRDVSGAGVGVAALLGNGTGKGLSGGGDSVEGVGGKEKKIVGQERCYVIGYNEKGGLLWKVNSRALCYVEGMCLTGKKMNIVRTMGWIGQNDDKSEAQVECAVVKAMGGVRVEREYHNVNNGGKCLNVVRKKLVMGLYGTEVMDRGNIEWLKHLQAKRYVGHGAERMKGVEFKAGFAIIVPKYEWTYNICHYNRVWNYIAHVIRHLKHFGVTEDDHHGRIDIFFRSGLSYGKTWMVGLRDALIEQLQMETGLKIVVGKLRFDRWREAQCVHKAMMLGLEGRVDSFPFLNDTEIWERKHNWIDRHWPIIPRQSLLLREAVYRKLGLEALNVFGKGEGRFGTKGEVARIQVPPMRVAYVLRSLRSRRRFGPTTKWWFRNTLYRLAAEMGFTVHEVSFTKNMPMGEQVAKLRHAGVATGIHGANFVNAMFMPPGGALVEMFPYRYARAYYLNGGNAGLRYSFHEARSGKDRGCDWSKLCFLKYRESRIDYSGEDRKHVEKTLRRALMYVKQLHERFPEGVIELEKVPEEDAYRIPVSKPRMNVHLAAKRENAR